MRLRDSIALTLPSFLLRLILGITFIWAGCGKLLGTFEVSGDNAARLANLGLVLSPTPPAPAQTTPPPANPTEPLESLPETTTPDPATPSDKPATPPQGDEAESLKDKADDIINTIKDKVGTASGENPAPLPKATPPSDKPTEPKPDEPKANPDTKPEVKKQVLAHPNATISLVQYSADRYAPSDFPEPVQTKRVYAIALMISKAADPGLTPDSQPIQPIAPASLANGPWPVVLAWAAAITELAGGVLLLLGLLTRFSALGTFGVMVVAMWMTQFGPAAIHANDAILGFIPNNQPWYSPESYSTLLWQLALAAMSLAVFFLGSGAIGIDRLLFSTSPRDPYVHGDPKASQRTAAPPSGASRTEFDRSPNPTP